MEFEDEKNPFQSPENKKNDPDYDFPPQEMDHNNLEDEVDNRISVRNKAISEL